MVFEPETYLCLYVRSTEKKFLNFSKCRIFPKAYFFLAKQRFCSSKRMQIDVHNFFVAQVVAEIKAKTQVSKSARCVFCNSLYYHTLIVVGADISV